MIHAEQEETELKDNFKELSGLWCVRCDYAFICGLFKVPTGWGLNAVA